MGSVGAAKRRNTVISTVQPQPQPVPPTPPVQPQPQPQPPISQQPPTNNNTPVVPGALNKLTQMTDDQMAQLVRSSVGIQMPNMLADRADVTQSFVFAAGLNEKPAVLDAAAFNQFMKDNHISQSEMLARSVKDITYKNQQGTQIKLTADQVLQMAMYSKLNYIGGKVGGQAYGAGTYFDMNGGKATGYGRGGNTSSTAVAVLNPKTAKVITDNNLYTKWRSFAQSHPKTASAVNRLSGNTDSIKALLMGYNVIKANYGSYHNVIDRSAIVYRQ